MPDTNPLLQAWNLPPWSEVRTEHLVPAITAIITDNRQVIAETIISQSVFPNWDDLVLAIDEIDARLDEALGIIQILSMAKHHDTAWSTATAACSHAGAQYRFEKMSNRPLFDAYRRLANSSIALNFDKPRKAALAKILRKFQLSAIDLPQTQREKLARLDLDIDRLEELFLIHLKSANAAWTKHVDDVAVLEGLYPAVKNRLRHLAKEAGHEGWLIPLDENTYQQIMRYAENRALREEYFAAYSTRASDQGPHADEFDNEPVLTLLLSLRHQKAQLLGFDNFAQMRLATAAAESTDQVRSFLRRQVTLNTPPLARDSKELQEFAVERGISEVHAWDHEFLAEQLRHHRFPEALKNLRDYFPLDGTLRRLCLFCERLFGIRILEQAEFSRWHNDVRLLEISEHGQTIGHIYLDPYHRKEAPDYAWTGTLRNRRINAEGRVALPIADLHCNFTPGVDGHPCLLEHKDLRMLFHEFGHCLQHVLTSSPHHNLSGISQLGRDTAEFAGQVFEQWCLSREFLLWLGVHHQRGERLTEARVDAALAALETQASRQAALMLTGAMFDFEVHLSQGDGRSTQQVFEDVRREVPHVQLPSYCRFANSFDYMVTGYAASVYAYTWSGVLAIEAFKRFRQDWVFNVRTGRAFREAFFSPGDSRSLLTALEAFLERPIADDLFALSSEAVAH